MNHEYDLAEQQAILEQNYQPLHNLAEQMGTPEKFFSGKYPIHSTVRYLYQFRAIGLIYDVDIKNLAHRAREKAVHSNDAWIIAHNLASKFDYFSRFLPIHLFRVPTITINGEILALSNKAPWIYPEVTVEDLASFAKIYLLVTDAELKILVEKYQEKYLRDKRVREREELEHQNAVRRRQARELVVQQRLDFRQKLENFKELLSRCDPQAMNILREFQDQERCLEVCWGILMHHFKNHECSLKDSNVLQFSRSQG